MILAIDAGNTRVKWATHDGRDFVHEGWVARADIVSLEQQWARLPPLASIVIANVAGEEIHQKLQGVLNRWPIALRWVSSLSAQAGVANSYIEPSQLGVDRWAALIAARQICPGACVVANAGTAMTVDMLSAQGQFLGGIVIPGFDLMHEALAANTAQLSGERGDFTAFPRTTRNAITSGAIHALCGAVERVYNEMLSAGHAKPELVMSGGAGEMLSVHIGRPVRRVDNLVLRGLVRIAQEPQ